MTRSDEQPERSEDGVDLTLIRCWLRRSGLARTHPNPTPIDMAHNGTSTIFL